jgi:hypothetical protein
MRPDIIGDRVDSRSPRAPDEQHAHDGKARDPVHQPDMPNLSEAIRRPVEMGLEVSGKGEKKPKG